MDYETMKAMERRGYNAFYDGLRNRWHLAKIKKAKK